MATGDIYPLMIQVTFGDFSSVWGCIVLLEDERSIFNTIDGKNALLEVDCLVAEKHILWHSFSVYKPPAFQYH